MAILKNILCISGAVALVAALPPSYAAVDDVSKIVIRPAVNASSNPLQIAELIAIDAISGSDQATLAQGATVTSTGIYANNSAYAANHAIDGDVTPGSDALQNYYHSLEATDQSLTVTLASPVSLSQLSIVGRSDCCSSRCGGALHT